MSESEIPDFAFPLVDQPVELTPPDISIYREGNTGVAYAHRFDSGKPGPRAMISAIVHGNEICGAIALDRLLREDFRPQRGSLTLVFANPRAYATFDPTNPAASRFIDEDLNRVWSTATLEGPRRSIELKRARTLRPLVDDVDILLDLHSMQYDSAPLILSGPADKGRVFAARLGLPPLIVADQGHASGRRLRDYAGFSDPDDTRNAILVECGQHWRTSTAELASHVTQRFLHLLGMSDSPAPEEHSGTEIAAPQCVEVTRAVTIRSDDARFLDQFTGLEVIADAGTPILVDGGDTICTPHDNCVLIMPVRHLHRGQTAVRLGRFIECGIPDGG